MKTDDIIAVKTLLAKPKRIVITVHKNPDGDAMGSSLGLLLYLKQNHDSVTVVLPNDCPDFLKWLPGFQSVINFEHHTIVASEIISKADIIFTLDFNALHRTGDQLSKVLETSKGIKIMIDHHQQPEDYATYLYSDVHMSSTCEMVYNFIAFLEDTECITPELATCIYTGIMTDTGSFKYRATSSKTHQVVADLIKKGADNTAIHSQVFDTNSYDRMQLLGRALQNLKMLPPYNTAYISLTQEELDTFNLKKGDTEGFVNYALSIDGIVFAAIFIENNMEGIIKISFRSKGNFSVNTFSRLHFEGGGHNNAAGGRSTSDLKSTIKKFEALLPKYKNDLVF